MKKVIIADDNRMVVDSLLRLIPWEQHGFEVVAKSFNGKGALEAIKKFGVDILITDIKMPGMDGLELIREIRKLGLDIKAVVLSSYNDFQLVREAMRLGASEYILKTELDPSSLVELLSTLSQQLEQERENTKIMMHDKNLEADIHRLREADNELYRMRRHIKDQMFREFCLGYVSVEQFMERRKEYLNIRFAPGRHVILFLSVDYFQKLLDMRWNRDEQLLSFAIMNVMGEILDAEEGTDLFYNGAGEFVIIISNESDDCEDCESISQWTYLFERLSKSLDHYLRIQISGGISSNKSPVNSIPGLYLDAMKSCQFRFILGKGKLLSNKDIIQSASSTISYKLSHERVDLLRNTLSAFHPQLLQRTISSLCVKQEEVAPTNFNEVLRLYEKYSFVLIDFIEQKGLKAVCGSLLEGFNEFIYDQEAVPELNRRLKEILMRISESMETGNSSVRQLIKYVQNNFRDEITLQSTAEQFGVTSAYLGRLVQKELNISFSDYLNNFRIERAKELLDEGNLKIYEIAEQVGYGSTEHFSRMFKRVVGISPKEYSSGRYL